VLADIASAPQRANIDDPGLFYRSAPVASPPAHNRNPLEIAFVRKYLFENMYTCCASPTNGSYQADDYAI
jgi:hypothetical protein